jgi:transcriptional regulator with XRE-family HTH domain
MPCLGLCQDLEVFPAYRGPFMPFDAEGFAHRLRAARVWKGLAPKELAAALGRTDQAVYDLESGKRRTPPDMLLMRALAAELGQSEEWFLSGTEPPWRTESSEIPSDVMRRLADARAALEEVEEAARRSAEASTRRRAENE